jgi:sigma-B regulation protein RsbU (phosphoserine phosphatase)
VVKRRPTVPFAPSDHALLSALAGTVVVALTNVFALEAARAGERKAQQLAAVQEELRRERRIAQALQEALLPQIPERIGPWLLSRRYEAQSPEAQVGGDIYDLFPLDAGRLGVLIADVSGKGLVAAQKTAMVKYALRSYAREHASPAEVVARLNDALFDEPDLTGFVTLVYGVLSDEDGGFTYASAGHETPLVRRRGGTFEALAPTGIVLGAVRDQEYGEASVVLSAGDGLLLYTDGLTEARPAGGDFLDVEGLQGILERLRDCPPREMARALLAAVRAYAGGSLSDDTAVLWIQRAAPGEPPPEAGD